MSYRKPEQWLKVIKEQRTSGLSAVAFCKNNNINPKYFSHQKNKLCPNKSSFIKAATVEIIIHANWMIKCGELIQPLINLIQDKLLDEPVMHMDETPVQVLNEPNKKAQSKSYMRVLTSLQSSAQPAVLFSYSPSRSGDIPKAQLSGFTGALMVDGYNGYQPVCDENA